MGPLFVYPAPRCAQEWLLHVSDTLTSRDSGQAMPLAPVLVRPCNPWLLSSLIPPTRLSSLP